MELYSHPGEDAIAMGSLELSEITEFPKERVLYNEVLCDKVNSKLKKVSQTASDCHGCS